uniref:Uncharacterized protein n=1 Tax=Arundo donax TaxID=35708 RepID=A0A0A9EPZ1_ARUDO
MFLFFISFVSAQSQLISCLSRRYLGLHAYCKFSRIGIHGVLLSQELLVTLSSYCNTLVC